MSGLLTWENIREALREPGPALGIFFAIVRARWYRLKYRLRGVDFRVGANFRCYGKLVVKGRGKITIGDNVVFRENLRHVYLGSGSADYTITVGSNVWLHGTTISCVDRVEVGDRSLVGRVEITDHEFHDPRDRSRVRVIRSEPIIIGEDCWVGNDCMLFKGVEIGDQAVVGARTVVRRSIPSRVIAIGNPARVVKELDEGEAAERETAET